MNYNADIAHCEGTGCPLANECKRFQLFQHWKEKKKEERLTPFVEPMYKDGKCINFLEYE